ncbi:MAG: oligosaccharide flippase family protein [Halioglobus sp.]
MIKLLLKDAFIYTVGSSLSRVLSLLLLPLYTRLLAPADYGSLDLLLMFAVLVNIALAMEISQGMARFYADEESPKAREIYASTAFLFTIFCYIAFTVVAFEYSEFLAARIVGSINHVVSFQISVIYISLNGILAFLQNLLRWQRRSREFAISGFTHSSTTAIMAIVFMYGLDLGLEGLLLGMVSGAFVSCFYLLILVRRSLGLNFELTKLKNMLGFSLPLVPSGIAIWASAYVDRIMINHFMTLEDVGVYGVGFRLASVIGLLMVGIQGALTPLIYSRYEDPETPRQLAKIFRYFVSAAFLVFVTMSLFAHDIFVMLTTAAYYRGGDVVAYLALAFLFSRMYIFAPGNAIAKNVSTIMWISLAGAMLNAGFNWTMIPEFGVQGAAIATLAAYFCVFLLQMASSQKLYPVPHNWWPLIAMLISSTGISILIPIITLDFSNLARWSLNLMMIAVVSALIVLLRLVKVCEIRRLLSLLKV